MLAESGPPQGCQRSVHAPEVPAPATFRVRSALTHDAYYVCREHIADAARLLCQAQLIGHVLVEPLTPAPLVWLEGSGADLFVEREAAR